MAHDLNGKKVAILAATGFEQVELTSPRDALVEAGAAVHVVSLDDGTIRGWDEDDWGDEVDVDVVVSEADADDYDALVIPGGVLNPDQLRRDEDAVAFVKKFFAGHKPVASICHGPWVIVEAGAAQGRRMTSFHSIKTDVQNAGATWVDEEVVVDQGLVTSRSPADLDAFNAKMVEEIREGAHAGQTL
jgi:protease I